MRCVSLFLAVLAACGAADAMPLGIRTAVWGVALGNARSEIERMLPDPAKCGETQISEIMSVFSDKSLGDYVTDKTKYAEFREWVIGSGARADALASSQMAWKSYAMNLPALAAPPQDGDLVIDDVSISVDGKLEAVFSLEDAAIGAAAAESRLKTVFGVEGSTELNDNAFSGQNIGLSLTPTGDGRVRATIVPPADAGSSFFLRVKVK